jgi:hypothetical protein
MARRGRRAASSARFRAQFEMLFEKSIRGRRPGHSAEPVLELWQFSVPDRGGDESNRIQGNAALFDAIGEKAIANCAGRAQGKSMQNNSAGAELFAKAGQA